MAVFEGATYHSARCLDSKLERGTHYAHFTVKDNLVLSPADFVAMFDGPDRVFVIGWNDKLYFLSMPLCIALLKKKKPANDPLWFVFVPYVAGMLATAAAVGWWLNRHLAPKK